LVRPSTRSHLNNHSRRKVIEKLPTQISVVNKVGRKWMRKKFPKVEANYFFSSNWIDWGVMKMNSRRQTFRKLLFGTLFLFWKWSLRTFYFENLCWELFILETSFWGTFYFEKFCWELCVYFENFCWELCFYFKNFCWKLLFFWKLLLGTCVFFKTFVGNIFTFILKSFVENCLFFKVCWELFKKFHVSVDLHHSVFNPAH